MMEDIKSGKINCIIVKDLSRLGRNYIEMGKYLEQIFPMMGIRFIAINDNYDNANTESSDSDSIVVPFKNLLNDSYCRDISIKVRSQLDMKRRNFEFDIQLVKSLVQKIEVSADKRIRIVFGFQNVFTELGKESAET